MHWRKSQEKKEQGSQNGKAPESEQRTSIRTSGYRKHKTALKAAARCLHFLRPLNGNHELSTSQGARASVCSRLHVSRHSCTLDFVTGL